MSSIRFVQAAAFLSVALAACAKEPQAEAEETFAPAHIEPQQDRYSYSEPSKIRVTHVALDLDVDFARKVLEGTATLDFTRIDPQAIKLVLDTNDLTISSVEALAGDAWTPVQHVLSPDDPTLGSSLTINLPESTSTIRIAYRTSPQASGLQWLAPEQTAGKKQPFMYSQGQEINARSYMPVQDAPSVRFTYRATLRTPSGVTAVMSAQTDQSAEGVHRFSMPQPIPAYLVALAVGDIAFAPISETIGVYAEPPVIAAAAAEFSDTPQMMEAAEALYGPYRWGRYDMLVLPPSFPFGGMENPRVSFLTPTLIAGDKSLVGTVAHELAHSWSGNLVTNARWRDSWLNEGVTSYVENRIVEIVFGQERAAMEQVLSGANIERAIAEAERPELTQLLLPADLADAGDAFNSGIAYAKGEFFLRFLEERFGRATFDAFLRSWFDAHAFKAVTTEDFRAFLDAELLPQKPGAVSAAELDEWIHAPGLPASAPHPQSQAFDIVHAEQIAFLTGTKAASAIASGAWSTQEWLHFLNTLPADISSARLAELDAAFNLTRSGNAEIASAWYLKAIPANYEAALPGVEAFLQRVGRGKFIYRIYQALADNDRKEFAVSVYQKSRPLYHPIAQKRIDEVLK